MFISSQQTGLSIAFGSKMIDKIGSCYPVSDKQKEVA
jgi:hypothetical protein